MKIPSNLEECFLELEKVLNTNDLNEFVTQPENDVILWHHSLGRWIRNNWGLWQGGVLANFFNTKGINHPDDMSGIILTSFWRYKNSIPIEIEVQIKRYIDYWKKNG